MTTEGFRNTFGYRVFISFTVSIVILLALFSLFFVYYQKGRARQGLIKEGKMLAELLAYSSKTAVFAENKALLGDAAQAVLKQKDVLAVEVLNVDRKVLVSKRKRVFKWNKEGREDIGAGFHFPELSESENSIEIVSPVTLEVYTSPAELLYFEDAPVARKKKVIGFVRVVMDKKALNRETEAVLVRSGIIALMFLFLGSLIIVFAIRRVIRPLTRLTESVRSLGRGESVAKVPVETADEVGRLAEAFNTMSDNLKDREMEKKTLEEKLRLAKTMEAIGTLARGIAHDFNNILSTVQGSVYMLEKKLYDDSPLKAYTGQISASLSKAKNLTQSLLTFSRTQTVSLHPMEVNTLIRNMKPLLAGVLGENIELDLSLSESELVIKADPVQIEQVIMNLCTNARDALPEGGRVAIGTAAVIVDGMEASDGRIEGRKRCVRVIISDSGAGMDEETREHIFEPFFTTKRSGRGNGLGLSIVYGIVEQHGGSIDVRTKAEEGTEFRIYFPLLEEKVVESMKH